MGYNSQQILANNIEAVRIALAWKEGETLSEQQLQSLQSYAGFGGIKAILLPNAPKEEWVQLNASKEDVRLYPQVIELHHLLQNNLNEKDYKQAIAAIKNSILTAFYTPSFILSSPLAKK